MLRLKCVPGFWFRSPSFRQLYINPVSGKKCFNLTLSLESPCQSGSFYTTTQHEQSTDHMDAPGQSRLINTELKKEKKKNLNSNFRKLYLCVNKEKRKQSAVLEELNGRKLPAVGLDHTGGYIWCHTSGRKYRAENTFSIRYTCVCAWAGKRRRRRV